MYKFFNQELFSALIKTLEDATRKGRIRWHLNVNSPLIILEWSCDDVTISTERVNEDYLIKMSANIDGSLKRFETVLFAKYFFDTVFRLKEYQLRDLNDEIICQVDKIVAKVSP